MRPVYLNHVFGDTSYFVARFSPKDEWAAAAAKAYAALRTVKITTTDEVLTEVLAAVSKSPPSIRRAAVQYVEGIMNDPHIEVIPQSRSSFMGGLDLYGKRLDKHYGLVDCISMWTMRTKGLTEVLTSDDHFKQEGFIILMKK